MSNARTPIRHLSGSRGIRNDNNKYGETLSLPVTEFPIRASASTRELEFQDRICEELYSWQKHHMPPSSPSFTLHDGPPYANGDLHMGHALNKVLKDIINRHKLMTGHIVEYTPGWDCHGLPIELKATDQKSSESMSALEIRTRAAGFAKAAIDRQRKQFKRWGVMGDWDGYYTTMSPRFEAAQLRVFLRMVEAGIVYRDLKPVHWSPSSKTALAEAELEYVDEHVSPSVYVALPILGDLPEKLVGRHARILIWTTTPWTLPSNEAVCFGADIVYACVTATHGAETDIDAELKSSSPSGSCFVVALDLVKSLEQHLGLNLEVQDTFVGSEMANCFYNQPFEGYKCPLLSGEHVTSEDGTGLVHIAPGHGLEDFLVSKSHNLPVRSLVTDGGTFTSQAGRGELEGLHIHREGTSKVKEMLRDAKLLIKERAYKHRYPYDWRTKQPVIQRATKQWFANLAYLGEKALSALDQVKLIPEGGHTRMRAMLTTRKEWCISRQRSWGLPIPVFYDKKDNSPLMTPETIATIADIFQTHGSDSWWRLSVDELLGEGMGEKYDKGLDTFDVWFDSGVSWSSVLLDQNLGYPADVVLEGSDQHRGWFQSSLLTSVSASDSSGAPYKTVITHGFVLDENNRKMSKSLGNVIFPSQIVDGSLPVEEFQVADQVGRGEEESVTLQNTSPSESGEEEKKRKKKKKKRKKNSSGGKGIPEALGADVLRLWVATSNYTQDVTIGSETINRVSGQYRKIRNTFRFLLGCVDDWNCESTYSLMDDGSPLLVIKDKASGTTVSGVPPLVDRYMLHQLHVLCSEVDDAYDRYYYSQATSLITHFINSRLSSFYLDTSKDRLYADAPGSFNRRAAQFVIIRILENLCKSLSPVMPHMTQEVYHFTPQAVRASFVGDCRGFESIFTHGWLEYDEIWLSDQVNSHMTVIDSLADEVNRTLETAREAEIIRSSLEASVTMRTSCGEMSELLSPLLETKELPFLLRVSSAELLPQAADTNSDATMDAPTTTATAATRDFQLPLDPIYDEVVADVQVTVRPAEGSKCPRCWNIGEIAPGADVCPRCADVMAGSA